MARDPKDAWGPVSRSCCVIALKTKKLVRMFWVSLLFSRYLIAPQGKCEKSFRSLLCRPWCHCFFSWKLEFSFILFQWRKELISHSIYTLVCYCMCFYQLFITRLFKNMLHLPLQHTCLFALLYAASIYAFTFYRNSFTRNVISFINA